MYKAASRLPHLLSPAGYFEPVQAELERTRVFDGLWHFVGTTHDLREAGMFLTRQILDTPLIVRNFDGQISALSNVCAHRHCLLTAEKQGKMETLRCRYHGWEYQADGLTGKIPGAQNFRPLADRPAIRRFRTELCGSLIFVALDETAPPLPEFLGELYPLCLDRFGPGWRQSLALEPDFAANWKVPVENSLESYHIPAVHPGSFAADPGDADSEHVLRADWTGFKAGKFATRWNDILLKQLEIAIQFERFVMRPPAGAYRHLHLYPNLLFSFTDTISLIWSVEPTSPVTSTAVVRQFGPCPRTAPWWHRLLLRFWNTLQAGVSRKIITEDLPVYADVQAGLTHSTQPGMLGRCEERIYAFQRWLTARSGGDVATSPEPGWSSDAEARAFIGLTLPAGNPGKSQPDRAA